MTKPFVQLLACNAMFMLSYSVFGYSAVYRVGYGAFAVLAAMIAGTFMWLWVKRSTPLALGMAFGWAGASCVMAWWWVFDVLGWPDVMTESRVLFVFLSLYFVGAIQHLNVISRSFDLPKKYAVLPVILAVGASLAVFLLV